MLILLWISPYTVCVRPHCGDASHQYTHTFVFSGSTTEYDPVNSLRMEGVMTPEASSRS